ncbi:amidohydrolase [Solitalea longa]|uniref:Amidohydrolase n=1 Tax=Solitalea longa TaxID=2079460 RepID=A0A2S5A9S9_9SPHI|nr:amidohydrolase family protein [Solitalea longa]POY39264.1 amidohydrolase [Solitalea longa]
MRKISADWVYTLSGAPLKNGVIVINDKNEVVDVLPGNEPSLDVEFFSGIICPGFINAHCHLELSHLRNKLPQRTGLVGFIQNVQQFREAKEEEILKAIEAAEDEMIQNGIVGVGDISNSSYTFDQKRKQRVNYHTFIEVFGFNPANAESIYNRAEELLAQAPQIASITPHAPYSVSEKLFELIDNTQLLSIHNQESKEENAFYINKTGDFLKLYQGFNLDISFFNPSGNNSLTTYFNWMGNGRKLLVHNTFTAEDDVDYVEAMGENFWCLCPNANLYIENGLPDISMFVKKELKLVLGTDSLASNTQLSILEEMKTISRHFSSIDLELMLIWTCKNGAELFGWDQLGTIEKGKIPGLNLIKNYTYDAKTGKLLLTGQSTVSKIC